MGVDQFGNPIRPIIHTEWSLQYVWDTGTLAWVPMTQTGGGGGGGTVDQGTGGVSPWLVTGPLTDAQLRAVAVPVSVATVPTHTVDQGLKNAGGVAAWYAQDDYIGGECLEDQAGAGAVLTFTFSSAVNLVVVLCNGTDLTARADPFGGTPTATKGFVCDDDIPVYLPITCTVIRVFAPASTTISVSGFRRA